MKSKECPSCAMEINEEEKICPICGYEFPVQNKAVKFVVIALVLIFMLFILATVF